MSGKYFLIFLVLPFLVTCARPNYQEIRQQDKLSEQSFGNGLHFSIEWERTPLSLRYESLTLKFYSVDNPTVFIDPIFQPFIQLWMPSMNHGASPVTVAKISDGIYQVSQIWFTMNGEWDLRVQLKEGTLVHEQVIIPLTL